MISPIQYFKDVYQEMQRVSWPTSRTVAVHTVIVIASMIGIIAIVSGIDYIFVTIIKQILFKGQL